jgi:hypothetical protein
MQSSPDPRHWLVLAHLEHAAGRLDLGPVELGADRFAIAWQGRFFDTNWDRALTV